jgi:hypothetical protein
MSLTFETVGVPTAVSLFNRITSKESSAIMSSPSADHLEFLRQTSFIVDGGPPSKETMKELVSLVKAKYKKTGKDYLAMVDLMCKQERRH